MTSQAEAAYSKDFQTGCLCDQSANQDENINRVALIGDVLAPIVLI